MNKNSLQPKFSKDIYFSKRNKKLQRNNFFIISIYLPLILAGCNTSILILFSDKILCGVTRLRNYALHAEPETMRYMSKSALYPKEPSMQAK